MINKGTAILCLSNPKSPSNVGAVMRAAGCYGAEAIYYSGTRFERANNYTQDTKDIQSKVPLIAEEDFQQLKNRDRKLVCIELVEGATPLISFEHPQDAIYVFGPEDGSIEQSTIDIADAVVYVPTIGCMNLAATVNVVLYDRMAKTIQSIDHDALIIESRDQNNRLKTKN
ncbi:RNA methyltransferase [Aurantivibrio plasticivorans]